MSNWTLSKNKPNIKTEDRCQKAEDRKQKTENEKTKPISNRKADNRWQKADNRIRSSVLSPLSCVRSSSLLAGSSLISRIFMHKKIDRISKFSKMLVFV